MQIEKVLGVTGVGLWRWDTISGQVTVDATTARLLGLPPEPPVKSDVVVRTCIDAGDLAEINTLVSRAVDERRVAEGTVRVRDQAGHVTRTVRIRVRSETEGSTDVLAGTLSEAPEPLARPGEAQRAAGTPLGVTGDWRRSREAFLLDAGRALAEAADTEEVLRVVESLSMPSFTPSGMLVMMRKGNRLEVLGQRGYDFTSAARTESLSLDTPYPGSEVVRTARPVYIPGRDDYARMYPATWPLIAPLGRRAWAYLPLSVRGEITGVWGVAYDHPVAFSPDERSVLSIISRMLAQALSRTFVRESERALTKGLQQSMLPANFPDIPDASLAGRYVPAGGSLEMGGDWYDVIPLPSGRFALVIGDAQGHDVRAATVMAQVRIALRAYASEGHSPDAVLYRASRYLAGLAQHHPAEDPADQRFVTCIYAEFDPETGTVDVARAGHPDLAVRASDGSLLLRSTEGGLPLGVFPDTEYPKTRLALVPGETLLLYTDGLIETGGHDFDTGWTRLNKIFQEQVAGIPPGRLVGPEARDALEEVADELIQGVAGPRSHRMAGPLPERRDDDIALLLLCRSKAKEVAEEPVMGRRAVFSVPQSAPGRISVARGQMRDMLNDWRDEDRADSAVLMLSETLANVLLHTDDDALAVIEILGRPGERRLRVEVLDRSNEMPHRRRPGELASSGRGLTLLEMLSDRWGVLPKGDGKSIWFEVDEEAEARDPTEMVMDVSPS